MRALRFWWGVGGLLLILLDAVFRLAKIALQALPLLSGTGLVCTLLWCVVLGYGEGWRAFHKGFSPRAVARAAYLEDSDERFWGWFAPIFCAALVRAPRRRLVVSWAVTIFVVAVVLLLRRVQQPLRGAIDAGVVVALLIGSGSLVFHAWNVRRGVGHKIDAEVQ